MKAEIFNHLTFMSVFFTQVQLQRFKAKHPNKESKKFLFDTTRAVWTILYISNLQVLVFICLFLHDFMYISGLRVWNVNVLFGLRLKWNGAEGWTHSCQNAFLQKN